MLKAAGFIPPGLDIQRRLTLPRLVTSGRDYSKRSRIAFSRALTSGLLIGVNLHIATEPTVSPGTFSFGKSFDLGFKLAQV